MYTKSLKLIEIGVDVFSVVNRLGGNEKLYLTICNKFINDETFWKFQVSLSKKDYSSAEINIHTLKGVAANLGFIHLEAISDFLLRDIRKKELHKIHKYNKRLTTEYHRIIKLLMETD